MVEPIGSFGKDEKLVGYLMKEYSFQACSSEKALQSNEMERCILILLAGGTVKSPGVDT